MDLQLKDKIAFVSGSTAGIGLAIAERLAAEGARVWLNGRTQARVDAARRHILERAPAAKVEGVAADLSHADGVANAVRAVPRVDILINNLGVFASQPFESITDADWLRFFETNVLSGIRLARAWLPDMKARNWGRIVFISSESGLNIPVEMIHYGVTKTAQLAVSRGLAESLAGTGITVNAVLPGPTASEGVQRFVGELAAERGTDAAAVERDMFRTDRPSSLLKRFIRPEEVANLVAYVASPLSSATTGAALRVDGGVVRAIA
ncbi:MAG TPA: SDR family oxidoreductase [Nevskiaceae bacterium]